MYEGRTRGKRLRYTYSDDEDFSSDNFGARRSTRTSGRETSTAPTGPTVTASGRQVRSRASGMYGETLHSGQVSDHATPATGDYDRSDLSEEPRSDTARGRSTRGGGRGAQNGRALHRSLGSDDESDATSWDGGDEDDDEPEEMEVDEEEDEQDEDSSEEEEPRSLVVTLHYGKGSSLASGSSPPAQQRPEIVNGVHSVNAAEVSVSTTDHVSARSSTLPRDTQLPNGINVTPAQHTVPFHTVNGSPIKQEQPQSTQPSLTNGFSRAQADSISPDTKTIGAAPLKAAPQISQPTPFASQHSTQTQQPISKPLPQAQT